MLSRRRALKQVGTGLALGAAALAAGAARGETRTLYKIQNKRIRQSVIHWCFKPMTVDQLADLAVELGLRSVELVAPENWPGLKKRGLVCAITPSHGFAKGFARKEDHAACLEVLRNSIDQSAEAGFPNVITFSGFRKGISDDEGMKNMVDGLKQIVAHAERKKVTLCLEMLNSRVTTEMKGHPDYFCDKIEMAVEICRQISSERMKILFDIYHVQIMEGDLITRIREFHPYIGHYHTAGVPGRGELDATQEINYPAVMQAIAETGYQGHVGQEFIPTRDKATSLSEAVKVCDI
jgi:hydroxypyruvate isomerase